MKRPAQATVVFLFAIILLASGSCQKSKSFVLEPIPLVSLCEIYENPASYEGKRITISATVTQLPAGTYLYPTSSCANGFRYVRVDANAIQSDALKELKSSSVSSLGRKEFEAEITGIFDTKYAEDIEAFRYRIVPSEIKQRSPVKNGRPLGAG